MAPRPALSEAEIVELERELGVPLPQELRAVPADAARDAGVELDFTGRTMDVEVAELAPAGIPFAGDGAGNFWLLDLRPQDTETAAVFFLCHDPPVFVYESPTLGDFLRTHVPAGDWSPPDFVEVGEIDHATAAAGDEQLRAFAAELTDAFTFLDLRAPERGSGFSWGRFGPRTELRRFGFERLFAYAPPEERPGVLGRLFR
jgi:hypothetical protein